MSNAPRRRRTKAIRQIIALNPMFEVIAYKIDRLGLGKPRLETGPGLMPGTHFDDSGGDRIRKGAVWFIKGKNCGFHVDFCTNGTIHIEAWTGAERHCSVWISGKVGEPSLKKDLTLCLAAAGLTDLARTEEVRATMFPRTATT